MSDLALDTTTVVENNQADELTEKLHTYFAGKRTDNVGRGIKNDTDNINAFLFIWQSHTSNNIFVMGMQ